MGQQGWEACTQGQEGHKKTTVQRKPGRIERQGAYFTSVTYKITTMKFVMQQM